MHAVQGGCPVTEVSTDLYWNMEKGHPSGPSLYVGGTGFSTSWYFQQHIVFSRY